MPHEFQYDVFLSHSSKDKLVVRDIAERLRKDGVKVWLDEWVLQPGDNIPSRIEQGLENSRVLVFCMSANAFGSDWAHLENQTFRFRDPLNQERRFIPLLLDDAPVKGTLAQFLYINWLPHKQDYTKLFEACQHSGQVQISESSTPSTEKQQRPVIVGWPTTLLTTRTDTPQWANYVDLGLNGDCLRKLECNISTQSPYFRFGFKLMGSESSRIFGDGVIKSTHEPNLLVHVGRNNFTKSNSEIREQDIFYTGYINGIRMGKDVKLFSAEPKVTLSLQLEIADGYLASFRVNDICCLTRNIPSEICRRVLMFAWGDHDEYVVAVQGLVMTKAPIL